MIDMELCYQNKKSEESILSKPSNKECLNFQLGESYLLEGDNLDYLLALSRKGFKGKIDLIYIDPPFNTSQDFVITNSRVSTISRTKTGFIAYSDNQSTEEYLEFLRERLIVMRELLSEEGSLYLHIDYKIGHYVKLILDEIFGIKSFKNDIARVKSNPKNFSRKAWGNEKDLILFYSKNPNKNIWNDVREEMTNEDLDKAFKKIDSSGRRYNTIPLHAPGETTGVTGGEWRGSFPPVGRHWRTDPSEFDRLDSLGLIEWSKSGNPRIIKYADEHKGKKIQDIWVFKDPQNPVYPTEKNSDMLDLIIKQSSKEGSYVMDCFAGSGGTLVSALRNNRKFVGIDQSTHAIDVIRNRLLDYDYHFLSDSEK